MKPQLREIGQTGIMVSPVALGCWPIAGMTSLEVNDADSRATIRAAIDAGINFFDTAHCYGIDGKSEKLVGEVCADCRHEVVVATKGGIHWDSDGVRHYDGSEKRIRSECEMSLQRMKTDVIDLYYLHAPDPDVAVEESAVAIGKLIRSGKVRSAGASNFNVDQLNRFHKICPISAVQPPYNMLQREIEADIIPWCIEHQVSVMNYWPLMKGLLAGKIRRGHQFDPKDKRLTYGVFQGESFERAQQLLDRLDTIAKELGRTVSQIVVNWNLNRQGITSVLCGAKRPWQIEDTAEAMGWQLNAAQLHKIDEALQICSTETPND